MNAFSETDLQKLFGHEAAEDEDPQRLREYYFKSSTYEQAITDLPLRILVGHKGIGKSALLQVAMAEDADQHRVAVLIKPDDVLGLGGDTTDFLQTIREWKDGLLDIITHKVLHSVGAPQESVAGKLKRYGGMALEFIRQTVKDVPHADLSPAKRVLVDTFLSHGRISVYIDDLDRGWQGRREDILRLSALLNAIRDISKANSGFRFRISLRSDVYYLVRTSDESTDKIEGSVVWHTWTNHEIFVLLVKRVETFFGRTAPGGELIKLSQVELARFLNPVMEPRFVGRGHWENAPTYKVLMSLIRKRPRDLVKLCTLAARAAREDHNSVIRTEHFERIFQQYSQGRVQDTINEFRSELPDIERLLLNMKPNRTERATNEGYVYSTAGLLAKIKNIMELGEFVFSTGRVATPRDLAAFMYKINFITARKMMHGRLIRRYFEENRYLSSEFADFGFDWEIHPAYRWALQADDGHTIYSSLQLSDE